jgi:hypothetical protein
MYIIVHTARRVYYRHNKLIHIYKFIIECAFEK